MEKTMKRIYKSPTSELVELKLNVIMQDNASVLTPGGGGDYDFGDGDYQDANKYEGNWSDIWKNMD